MSSTLSGFSLKLDGVADTLRGAKNYSEWTKFPLYG